MKEIGGLTQTDSPVSRQTGSKMSFFMELFLTLGKHFKATCSQNVKNNYTSNKNYESCFLFNNISMFAAPCAPV